MKKIILLSVMLCLALFSFAEEGGRHKIGGYIGYPTGLSYGYEFNDLIEIDLLFATSFGGMHIGLAPLFTVYEPEIDGMICPLTIGPALGYGFAWGFGPTIGVAIAHSIELAVPVRWEVNFKDVKNFNLFVELGPGIGMVMVPGAGVAVAFAPRAGVGLRTYL